jgi:hypothetical protein
MATSGPRRLWLQLALALPWLGAARAADVGPLRISLLDGSATVLDGAERGGAVPGLALSAGAIVETGPQARLLRIESPEGQAVDLGADTHIMLNPPGFVRRGQPSPALYLLRGWLKLSGAGPAGTMALVTGSYELPSFQGVAVAHASADEAWLFVESGQAGLIERGRRDSAPREVGRGAFYLRATGGGEGALTPRASSAQLQRVPRVFRDTLPLRYADVSGGAPKPQPLDAPAYADLQPWLVAERSVRSGFTTRFRPLLRDRAFRHELDAHLRDHPEWRPILHPPPPPPPPSAPKPR